MTRFGFILAQTAYQNRLKGLRGAFNEKPSNPADMKAFFIFVAAMAVLILFVVLVKQLRLRKERKAAPRHPARLFNRVLKRMELNLTDRLFMRMLAAGIYLRQPTIIFFSRDLFERHTEKWLNGISVKSFRNRARKRLKSIAEKAFTDGEVDAASHDSKTAASA